MGPPPPPSLSDHSGGKENENLPIPTPPDGEIKPEHEHPNDIKPENHSEPPKIHEHQSHKENFDAIMDTGSSPSEIVTDNQNNQVVANTTPNMFQGIGVPTIDTYVIVDQVLLQPALYLFKVSLLPINVASSLIAPDEDKALEYAAALSLKNMKKIPIFSSAAILMETALNLFNELRLNSIRPLFKKRMQQIIVFLGQGSGGLYSYCNQYKKVLTAEHLYKLENHIYKAMKYFKKFTKDDFVQYTFCGKEPQINFGTFERDTLKECLDLSESFDFRNKYLLPVQLSYFVVCDLKDGVLIAAGDPHAMEAMAHVDFGLEPGSEDYDNFKTEVFKTATSINELQVEAENICTYYPAEIISNKAIRNFWKKYFDKGISAQLANFENSLYSELRSLGEEDTKALAIAYALVYAIKTTETPCYKLYEEDSINYLELDRMLRSIDPTETLYNSVTALTTRIVSNCVRLLPKHLSLLDNIFDSANPHEVFWDEAQREVMINALTSNTGWISICGPKNSGKTCRILDACLDLPVDRDCVYIDMSKVSTEMECVSRVISQLHLMECSTKESFNTCFNKFLSELKFGSVVIFDNIDGDEKAETITSFSSFATAIFKLCEPFETSLCFVIVGRHMTNLSFVVQTINIPALQGDVVISLANKLLPMDPNALVTASQGYSGLMYYLTMKCNIDTIRAIAVNTSADPAALQAVYGSEPGGMSHDVNSALSEDEKLLAGCLLKVSASFGPAMSWYISKENFSDDIVRWYLAWKGLIAKGWLSCDGYLNYMVAKDATVSSSLNATAPTLQEQWRRYCLFWAQHLQDVSACCEDSLMPWEDFDKYRHHYKNMLGCFFKQQNSEEETTLTNISELAALLSGGVVRLLNFRFSPEGGVLLANAIVAAIDASDESYALTYFKAVADLGVQMRRAERYDEAIRIMEKAQKTHEKLITDAEVLGRFYAVLGNLHHSKKRLTKADQIYSKALQHWDSIGLTEDTHKATKLTKERQELLRQQKGCNTCTIS